MSIGIRIGLLLSTTVAETYDSYSAFYPRLNRQFPQILWKKNTLELSLTNKRPTPNLPGVNGKKRKNLYDCTSIRLLKREGKYIHSQPKSLGPPSILTLNTYNSLTMDTKAMILLLF